MSLPKFDKSEPVLYHYGAFPPQNLDYSALIDPLAEAAASIARYEQMLKGMHNSRLFLTPLARQEALSSSRMEGTISTLDELLEFEANLEENESTHNARRDTLEVHAYRMAMHRAENLINKGHNLSPEVMCKCHEVLLQFTRGKEKSPGQFKTDQNYLVDLASRKILFTPIAPEHLKSGLDELFMFIDQSDFHPLIKTAIFHVEFESLHPFNDGNGRVGRIFITLMLWQLGQIARPYFYISGYLEQRKEEYIQYMRSVSADGDWTSWCIFFLEVIQGQTELNYRKSEEIRDLYENMKEVFRTTLSSQWSINALDFIFANPIFRNNTFTGQSNIPKQTANRFTNILLDAELLTTIRAPSGRRAGLYAFEPLLQIVRN